MSFHLVVGVSRLRVWLGICGGGFDEGNGFSGEAREKIVRVVVCSS